ncbi:MAG: ComEC family competence protein [Flavobacterium sp.]|nr:MAG: ComEC family competence protein [Flavobacterium sp.]
MQRSSSVTNSEIFYVRAFLPFSAGIVFLKWSPWTTLPIIPIYILAGLLAFCLLLLNLCYRRLKVYRYKISLSVAFHFLMFVVGYALAINKSEVLSYDHFASRPYSFLKIVVNQEPQLKSKVLMFKAKVVRGYDTLSSFKTTGNLLVSLKLDSIFNREIFYGDVIIIPYAVQATKANPNPATFNYKNWLETQHINHQIFISPDQVLFTKENEGTWLIKQALVLRRQQVNYFRKILKDDNVYSVASTLILGYRADLDEELLSYYSKTGTIHALSVSGMHVGLIYVVLEWIFSFLNRHRASKAFKLMTILSLIWSYTVLTGLSPSVLRAAIMISVFMVGKRINRSANGVNILAFSGFLILVYDPLTLWDVGFQLSYLAVLGLILVQPSIENWFYFKNSILRKIWSAVSISLAAQLFTFPLSVYYFHQFPMYFIFSNLFILLPVTGIMYLGILILLFRLTFLSESLEWLINMTNSGLKYIAELPFSNMSSIWISSLELVLMSIGIAAFLFALKSYKKSVILYALILCLGLQILSAFDKFDKANQRKLVIFNIRNHYAVAFITGKEVILYSRLKVQDKLFKNNIQPFLDQQHIKLITCTEDISSIKRLYFKNTGDEIQFHDYSLSKTELQQMKLGLKSAIVKDID